MAGWALYLLGFIRAADAPRLALPCALMGGAGRPFAVTSNGVAAVVEAAALDELGPEALQRNIQDPAWVADRARRHHQVLEALARAAPVAPAKLGTVFLEQERVVRLLEAHAAELARFLDWVEGKEEWGLSVFAEAAALEALADRGHPLLAELAAQLTRAQPGAAYLLGKRQRRLRAEEARRLAGERARSLAEAIEGAAQAVVELPEAAVAVRSAEADATSVLLLRLAVLVARVRREQFERELASIAESHQDAGARVELCGPWPPYSFCPSLVARAPAEEEASP